MDCAAHLLVLVVEKLRLDQVRGKAIEARISSRVWLDVIFAQGSVDLLELLDEFILLGLIVGYGWLRRVGGWGSGLDGVLCFGKSEGAGCCYDVSRGFERFYAVQRDIR